MSEESNAVAEAIQAGRQIAGIEPRFRHVTLAGGPTEIGVPIAVIVDESGERVALCDDVLQALEDRQPTPRARKTSHTLLELDSLVAYVNRYKSSNALAYANVGDFAIAVIFDDHSAGATGAAWRKHSAHYRCPRSPEWVAWCERDGKPQAQEAFADFIEARLEDMRAADGYPKPLDMLQMARNLIVRQMGTFQRSINPTTGESVLVNKTENTSESTQIPRAFVIGVPVFEGGTPYQVECRIRCEVSGGRAMFSYTMHRRREIERDAFGDVRKSFADGTGVLTLAGVP